MEAVATTTTSVSLYGESQLRLGCEVTVPHEAATNCENSTTMSCHDDLMTRKDERTITVDESIVFWVPSTSESFSTEDDMETEVVQMDSGVFATLRLTIGPALGFGMSGPVVLATSQADPNDKKAVKVFPLTDADRSAKSRKLFNREVEMMRSLSHPHVIERGLAASCPSRYLAIVTKYYANGTLASHLKDLNDDLTERFFVQVRNIITILDMSFFFSSSFLSFFCFTILSIV